MNHDWVLWVLTAASALHVMEEHALGWQGWAARTFGPRLGVTPTWSDFWATNTVLIVLAFACATVGWRAPWFALALPALCIINAVLFHLLPTIAAKRPNPGVFTGLTLYLPLSVWAYVEANRDGCLSIGTVLISVVVGAALMASAIGALALGKRFGYQDS